MSISTKHLAWLATGLVIASGCRQILGIEDSVLESDGDASTSADGSDSSTGADANAGVDASTNTLFTWRDVTRVADSPDPRDRHAMTYDAARERVVLFGGIGAEGALFGDTWEVDGAEWAEKPPAQDSPEPRQLHAMTYAAARERVVLFGGVGEGLNVFGDTWEWNGDTWADVTPDSGSPDPRDRHAITYDAARERVVLFGGFRAGGFLERFGDTWTWDGEKWTEVTPASGSPDPRQLHAMAYDAARERVVLFSGESESSGYLGDTWEWDGELWAEVTPDAGSPEPRVRHAMAYDAGRERVVLFGGQGDSQFFDDAWEWDGASWTEVTPASGSPEPRHAHSMAYDASRGRVVVFGGAGADGRFGDTWVGGPAVEE